MLVSPQWRVWGKLVLVCRETFGLLQSSQGAPLPLAKGTVSGSCAAELGAKKWLDGGGDEMHARGSEICRWTSREVPSIARMGGKGIVGRRGGEEGQEEEEEGGGRRKRGSRIKGERNKRRKEM